MLNNRGSGPQTVAPEEISAMTLSKMKLTAETFLGEKKSTMQSSLFLHILMMHSVKQQMMLVLCLE